MATSLCYFSFASREGFIGRLAQLVEHLVYTERVVGSSPTASTMDISASMRFFLVRAAGQAVFADRCCQMEFPQFTRLKMGDFTVMFRRDFAETGCENLQRISV